MTLSQDDELLLNAYLDGELDPLEARSFEARLASEPALAGEIEAYRLLRSALRSDLAEDVPSPGLKRRIMSSPALRPPRHIPAWGSLAASFLAGAVLAGSITLGALHRQAGDEIASEVVSAHIRGLMAPISLTAIPAGKEAAAPPRSHEERGFLARTWTQGGVTYFAVSDAAVEELEAFVKLFRAEVARNG